LKFKNISPLIDIATMSKFWIIELQDKNDSKSSYEIILSGGTHPPAVQIRIEQGKYIYSNFYFVTKSTAQ